jgi:quercetin dioxygenase-like cupin family protein
VRSQHEEDPNRRRRAMSKITFDRDEDNRVTPQYSEARGPVLRSERIEVTKAMFDAGKGAKTHSHAEEQVFYIVKGRLRVTCDGETYEVGAGEGSFHPSNAEHTVQALEDTVAISFKNLVDPTYEKTGELR